MTTVIDLFAGVGFGVACQRLGLEELGFDNARAVLATRDAAGMTSKAGRNFWVPWGLTHRPAVTVGNAVGRGLIGGQGAKDGILKAMDRGEWVDSPHGDGSTYAERTRITHAEAGVLQTFPADFPWQGTTTEKFLTIGNAVPPLLAEVVIQSALEGQQ